MVSLVLKAAVTAIFIVALSELAKRSPSLAGLLVALPLATALTMVLMHIDGTGREQISAFAWSTLMFVPPGLVFVAGIWGGLVSGFGFWTSFVGSIVATGIAFWVYLTNLARLGIKLL